MSITRCGFNNEFRCCDAVTNLFATMIHLLQVLDNVQAQTMERLCVRKGENTLKHTIRGWLPWLRPFFSLSDVDNAVWRSQTNISEEEGVTKKESKALKQESRKWERRYYRGRRTPTHQPIRSSSIRKDIQIQSIREPAEQQGLSFHYQYT